MDGHPPAPAGDRIPPTDRLTVTYRLTGTVVAHQGPHPHRSHTLGRTALMASEYTKLSITLPGIAGGAEGSIFR